MAHRLVTAAASPLIGLAAGGFDLLRRVPAGLQRVDVAWPHCKRVERTAAIATGGRDPKLTPEEAIQAAHKTLRKSLAADLLDQVKQVSPAFFEHLVVDVLVHMGYGGSRQEAGEAIGQAGDEGIDGIIKEDRLGLDIIKLEISILTSQYAEI